METAIGVAAILFLVLPFVALSGTVRTLAHDLGEAHSQVRLLVHGESEGITFTCRLTPDSPDQPCTAPLGPGTYVVVTKDSTVPLPFGFQSLITLRAVARVEE